MNEDNRFKKIEDDLIAEIKLKPIEAKIFLLVTIQGKMSTGMISKKLEISKKEAEIGAKKIESLGGFIEFPDTKEYQAMHPRFTAVNMYRRMCEKQNIDFKRNDIVDNIGVVLEKYYL